jgi:hypothetical protein
MAAMDIANLLSLGVRHVIAHCVCGREIRLDVSKMDGAIEVPALKGKLRCSECGERPAWVRPDWTDNRERGVCNNMLSQLPPQRR